MVKAQTETTEPLYFWHWLKRNGDRVKKSLQQGQMDVHEEINRAFQQSYPELVWEISPAAEGPWTFCISAEGTRTFFPFVEKAVAEAPTIPGWHIQAFRARGSLDAEINMDNVTLSYHDIWCLMNPTPEGLSVCFHVRGLNSDNAEMLIEATFILLDNAIGEYDAATRIHEIDFDVLPETVEESELYFPMHQLPAWLDRTQTS